MSKKHHGEQEEPMATEPAEQDNELETLRHELEQARQEARDQRDAHLRARADLENYKRRAERTYGEIARNSRKDVLGKVLGVMDNLERALLHQDTPDQASLLQGLRLTQWQLAQILEQEGLKAVPSVGEPFNPHMHDALATVHSEEHPEGTIVDEIRKGYMLGDDVLRPAQVRVSMGPGTEKA